MEAGGVSVTTETLMEALDRSLEGVEVERGGALHAKPDDNVRRRIQVFKRLEAERDDAGDGFGDIEDELIAEGVADVDREDALRRLFAASRKNGPDSKRPKGFAPWRPQRKTLVVLAQVKDILDEYRAELPLTARQIFYRLVGAYGYPKNENAYERLTKYSSGPGAQDACHSSPSATTGRLYWPARTTRTKRISTGTYANWARTGLKTSSPTRGWTFVSTARLLA